MFSKHQRENNFPFAKLFYVEHLKTPGERLVYLIKLLKTNTLKFSKRAGIGYAYLSQMRNNTRPFTKSSAFKIEQAYPEINGNWVLTGEGQPMKETDSSHPHATELPPQVNEPSAEYERKASDIPLVAVPDLLFSILERLAELQKQVEEIQGRLHILESRVEDVGHCKDNQ